MLTDRKSDHHQKIKISDISGKLEPITGEIKGEIDCLSIVLHTSRVCSSTSSTGVPRAEHARA